MKTVLANKRQSMGFALCREWIKLHRPDVWAAITKEIEARFPRKRSAGKKIFLTTTLEKMK